MASLSYLIEKCASTLIFYIMYMHTSAIKDNPV